MKVSKAHVHANNRITTHPYRIDAPWGVLGLPPEDPEAGGEGEGGGGERTFTQADVDRIVTQRLKKANGELESLRSESAKMKEQLGALDSLREEFESLKSEKELAGKSEVEKLQARFEKDQNTLKRQIEELAKERDQAKEMATGAAQRLRSTMIRQSVTDAFMKAKVLPRAADDAVRSFLDSVDMDVNDENFSVEHVVIGDTGFTDLSKAAEAWLKEKPYYAQASAGGSGTNGMGGVPKPDTNVDRKGTEDLALALSQPAPKPRPDAFDDAE